MAENIRNRQQWCAVHQECTCKGTSQRMDRFSIFSCQTCVCNVFLKRRRYGSAGLESTIGMEVPNKDIVTIGIKSTVSQIVNNCFSNHRQQRQSTDFSGFLLRVSNQLLVPISYCCYVGADCENQTQDKKEPQHP